MQLFHYYLRGDHPAGADDGEGDLVRAAISGVATEILTPQGEWVVDTSMATSRRNADHTFTGISALRARQLASTWWKLGRFPRLPDLEAAPVDDQAQYVKSLLAEITSTPSGGVSPLRAWRYLRAKGVAPPECTDEHGWALVRVPNGAPLEFAENLAGDGFWRHVRLVGLPPATAWGVVLEEVDRGWADAFIADMVTSGRWVVAGDPATMRMSPIVAGILSQRLAQNGYPGVLTPSPNTAPGTPQLRWTPSGTPAATPPNVTSSEPVNIFRFFMWTTDEPKAGRPDTYVKRAPVCGESKFLEFLGADGEWHREGYRNSLGPEYVEITRDEADQFVSKGISTGIYQKTPDPDLTRTDDGQLTRIVTGILHEIEVNAVIPVNPQKIWRYFHVWRAAEGANNGPNAWRIICRQPIGATLDIAEGIRKDGKWGYAPQLRMAEETRLNSIEHWQTHELDREGAVALARDLVTAGDLVTLPDVDELVMCSVVAEFVVDRLAENGYPGKLVLSERSNPEDDQLAWVPLPIHSTEAQTQLGTTDHLERP